MTISYGRFTSKHDGSLIPMKYMTDANLAQVAPRLREKSLDCETLHKRMRNHEASQEKIVDGEIVAFLRQADGSITLITSDIDLADHCKFGNLPHITVWDAVAEYILNKPGEGSAQPSP